MGGKTGTTTSQVRIPPEVLARYTSVNQRAENVAQTPFQQYSTDPNAFVAPLNSTQQAGVANTNAAAGMAQPYFGAATEALGQGLGAAVPFTLASAQAVNPSDLNSSAINKYLSPYLGTVLGTTMAAQAQQNAQQRSAMQGDAIQAGAFGGDRAGIGQANLAYQQNLANSQTIANLLNQGYGQALSTAQQQQGVDLSADQANRAALGAAGQNLYNQFSGYGQNLAGLGAGAQGAALQGAQAQLQAGQVGQQTQQAGLSALYNQFLQQQSYPFQVAQFLANIAMGTGALSGSQTTTQQPMPFFSDERLKEDIEPIGETYDGQKIVKFRYRGQPGKQIGLLAQDVEKHHPEAVGQSHGFKTVDYDAATADAAYEGGLAHPNVVRMADYARKAGGGLVGADDLQAMIQQRTQMYGALPWAQAGLYGAQAVGMPRGGAGGVVPTASLHVPALVTAKSPSSGSMPRTGLQEVMGLAKDVAGMADTAQGLGKAYEGAKGVAGKAGDLIEGLFGPKKPDDQWGNAPWDAAPRAFGGQVDEDSPQGIYEPVAGLNIPQTKPGLKLDPPAPPGTPPAGGLGSAAKDVASLVGAGKTIGQGIEWLLPLLGLKDGGAVRQGMAEGGEPEDPAKATFDYFVNRGLSPERAAAITAQVKHESNFNPTVTHDGGIGYGLLGWNGPRLAAMRQQFGDTPSREQQLEFLHNEIATGLDPGMGKWGKLPDADAGTLAADLSSMGVRPRDVEGNRRARAATAMQYYNQFAGSPRAGLAPREAPLEANISTTSEGLAPASSFGQMQGEVQQPRERGWLDRNRDWLLPALQFVGTTASSPSRYLGAALLQGAAGAAKGIGQAAELEQRQQALDTGRMAQNTSAYRAQNEQQIQQHAMVVGAYDPKTGQFIVYGPDNRPTRMLANDFYARIRSGNAPRLVPGGASPTQSGASAQPGTSPTATPEAASAAPEPPKPEALPANVATPQKPTAAKSASEYLYTVPVGSAGQRELQAEQRLYETQVPSEAQRHEITKRVADIQSAGNSAQANRAALLELADAGVRPDGFLTTGPRINERVQLAGAVNALGRYFGLDIGVKPEELAAGEISRKLFSDRVAARAQQMGERSAIALPLLERGIVNGELSPESIKQMIADQMIADQKQIDLAAYAKKYAQGAQGIFPVGANVVNAFNQDFGEDHYRRERNMLMDVMTPGEVPGTNHKASPMHFLINPRAAETYPDVVKRLTPAVFEKVYGPGTYRYITGRVN